MESLGFIGTGTITRHIVLGLKASALAGVPVILSPRNAEVARELSALPGVTVAASNQEVLDRAGVVVLAVRPQVAAEVLTALTFPPRTPLISLIATLPLARLAALTGAAPVCRAIPLPFVERRSGVTPVFPALAPAVALFDALGQALVLPEEAAFDTYAAASALMGSYFGLVETASTWMQAQGIPGPEAETYLRALFADLGRTLAENPAPPEALREAHSTRGGLNEQLHRVFADQGGSRALGLALDQVLARIRA